MVLAVVVANIRALGEGNSRAGALYKHWAGNIMVGGEAVGEKDDAAQERDNGENLEKATSFVGFMFEIEIFMFRLGCCRPGLGHGCHAIAARIVMLGRPPLHLPGSGSV